MGAPPAAEAAALRAMELLLARDPAGRNVGGFRPDDGLAPAARALLDARRALVITGFLVLASDGAEAPETDGPQGALALGEALRALGAEVSYATDAACEAPLRALGAAPLDVLDLPAGDPDTPAAARAWLAQQDPTHVVAVERPGRALDGLYRSMRGRVLARVAALDELLLAAREAGRVTVGVGDGGNEAGLGALRARVVSAVPHGEQIATVIPADHTVVAGTSTWGALALTAALGRLAGRDLLPDAARFLRDLDAVVAAGAVDGVTGRAEATIDGLPLDVTLEMLEALRALAATPSR